jgi:hypothetical protein
MSQKYLGPPKPTSYELIGFFSLVLILGILTYPTKYSPYFSAFKTGDCIRMLNTNEFSKEKYQDPLILKIDAIGEKSYKVSVCLIDIDCSIVPWGEDMYPPLSFSSQEYFEKVECPK